jgi:hypothetical protein
MAAKIVKKFKMAAAATCLGGRELGHVAEVALFHFSRARKQERELLVQKTYKNGNV